MTRFFYNEEINAARLALRDAVASVKEFCLSDTPDSDVVALLIAILKVEGIPPDHFGDDHARWDAIRKRL